MASPVPPSMDYLIIEEREEFMVSPLHTGGLGNKRIAHFLKPTVASLEHSSFKLPLLSPERKWPCDVVFNDRQRPLRMWNKWVDQMFLKYHSVWKKAGIIEAILSSKYKFKRNDELIFGVAERWCAETNTFIFRWGEASITLEDMMILGGFSVLGSPVLQPLEGRDLLDIETYLKNELKKLEKRKRHTHVQWISLFMRDNKQYEHEAFLVSWLSGFVFPVDEITKINLHILPIAVNLSKGTKVALAPAVLASIYRDLSLLKEIMTTSPRQEAEGGEGNMIALKHWAPLHLVHLWVWERFPALRPNPKPLGPSEPRIARWLDRERLVIGNVRPIIDSSHEAFLWRPYCLTLHNWCFPKFYMERDEWVHISQFSDEELESFACCLRVCVLVGIDCEEHYQPHRVAMQFGYDQDLPGFVSHSDSGTETAWTNYSRPFSDDKYLYFPSMLSKAEVSIRYLDWWRNSVLAPVMPDADSDAPMVQNIQGPTMTVQVPNKQQIKMEEDYPDVPPGFSPKVSKDNDLKNLLDSTPERGRVRLESSNKPQIIDLNLLPESPPQSQSASSLETNEIGGGNSVHDDQSGDRDGLFRSRVRMVQSSEFGMPKRVKTESEEY